MEEFMQNNKATLITSIILVAGIIILGLAGFFFLESKPKQIQNGQNSTAKVVPTQNPNSIKIKHYVVTVELTETGFSKATLDEKQGVIVQLKNSTPTLITIIAGQTTFKIDAGKTYPLNFDNPGEFKYVNEAKKDQSLSITVK